MKIGVIYGSTRYQGNTEWLTEEVIKNLPAVTKIDLKNISLTILPIRDTKEMDSYQWKMNMAK